MKIERFQDMIGNSLVISLIRKGTKNKTLPQFILLSGIHGTGKSSSAELTAMALTCEAPIEGDACNSCDTCKKNKIALKPGGTGVSSRIEKINMALVSENRTMKDVLKSTFQVLRSDGIYVKIFEEFHRLSERDQGLILEETSRVSSNIFVILTTTRIDAILKEIQSRCLVFSFSKLNKGEAIALVDKVNQNLKLKPEDYTAIYQKTDGIPRNIVLIMEFLSASGSTYDELDMLLGNINKEIFIELFSNVHTFRLYMDDVDNLLSKYPVEPVLQKLMDFIVQVIFALEGGIHDVITKKVLKSLPIKDTGTAYKIVKLLENSVPQEQSFKLALMRIRKLLAPVMTMHEQQTTANLSHSVNPGQTVTPLKRFSIDTASSYK